MSHLKAILAIPTMFLVCLAASVIVASAKDDRLEGLVKQLTDRKPETQIAACREIAGLGSEAAPVGAALVETMIRAKGNMDVWQAAADALEKVAPKVQPHVLTIMLNDDSKGQYRLTAAQCIGDLKDEGAAGLPLLKALWSEPSHNYKQRALLESLHAIAPRDEQVSKLMLMVALGKLDKVLLGALECKAKAVDLIVESNLSDDEINEALAASVAGRYAGYNATDRLVKRVQERKASKEQVTALFVAAFIKAIKRNPLDQGFLKPLKAMGADAVSAIPALSQFKMHPDQGVRAAVKETLDAINQASLVKVPVEGDVWEVKHLYKNGNAEIQCGAQNRLLRPEYDRVAIFDAMGAAVRDKGAIRSAIQIGVKLKLQIEQEKVISAKIVK